MDYACSLLEIKAFSDANGKRTFTGMATTPETDRSGDIVEPKGAEFKLPIPLLWMHNSRDPVGWVTGAKVTDKGIEIEGEIAVIDEPPSLKDRLETAWSMLRSKLVQGLSIGFKPLESSRIGDTYSYRYTKWLWLELSPVTVPDNGGASISQIKSIDKPLRQSSPGGRRVVRLDTQPATAGNPGASGQAVRRKGVVYLTPERNMK